MQRSNLNPIKGKISKISDLIVSSKNIRKKVVIVDLKHDNQMKFEFVGNKRLNWLRSIKIGNNVQVTYLCKVSIDKHNRHHQNNIALAIRRL